MGLFEEFDEFEEFEDLESMTIEEASELCAALADEVPRVVQEIAPEGWAKSKYKESVRRFNRRSDLLHVYRSSIAMDYMMHKVLHPGKPFKVNKYIADFSELEPFPDSKHHEATVFYILANVICVLSRQQNLVSGPQRRVRYFELYHLKSVLPDLLSRRKLWPDEKIAKILLLHIDDLEIEEGMAPFYTAAFRALKKLGYDWFYFHDHMGAIMWDIEEYNNLKWSPTAKCEDGMTAADYLEEIKERLMESGLEDVDPLDEEGICAAYNRKPPGDDLLAYLEVYGELPDKYPMKVEDYKDFEN